jgi:peptidoglycan/LPS O-acetylase OafA/YrhL
MPRLPLFSGLCFAVTLNKWRSEIPGATQKANSLTIETSSQTRQTDPGSPAANQGAAGTFYGVQALRAMAAMLVVFEHCIYLWLSRIVGQPKASYWMNGAAGVDIFFVISGFVMTVTLPNIRKYSRPIAVFLRRRITRIVPLYWLATTLKVALLLAAPALAIHQTITLPNVLGSYFFWPVLNGEGLLAPVIIVGWTLNFEMFFYLIFSGAMSFGRRTISALTVAILLLTALSLVRRPSWPTVTSFASPLLLEFLYGVAIARLAQRRRLPGEAFNWWIMGLGSLAILALFPHLPDEPNLTAWRFLLWGTPAAMIVLGTVALEHRLRKLIPKWVISLGDSSYAIYLTQTFVLPVVGIAVARLELKGWPALVACIFGGLLFSALAGEGVHRFVELPILALLKNKERLRNNA